MIARILIAVTLLLATVAASGARLPDTIERIAPSVVMVGTHAPLRQPPDRFRGTGFAVGDGRLIATNAHVLPEMLDAEANETLAVYVGAGREARRRAVEVVARDPAHDLALLRLEGEALRGLRLGDAGAVRPGERYAFTGFPIGTVLGPYPVTHEALIAAVTPIAIPQGRAERLDPALIQRLRNPYEVFQLDATAYPGNSGSPLYDPRNGSVVGIVNMVFVKDTKESVLADPSGIAYAIPVRYLRALLGRVDRD